MIKPTGRHLLPLLLPLLAMTVAASKAATLTVSPSEAYLGDTVTITGAGFESCTEPPVVEVLRLVPFTMHSEPPGIELPSIEVAGEFDGTARVSPNAAPGPYTISVLCTNMRGGVSPVTDSAVLTVLVEPDDQPTAEVVEPADPVDNVDSPTDRDAQQKPSIPVRPEVQPAQFGASGVGLFLLLGLALVLVLLAGLALMRWLLKRPPAVYVRPVTGVVVGPRVRATPPEQDGVRIMLRADPGTRVLSTQRREGRKSSW